MKLYGSKDAKESEESSQDDDGNEDDDDDVKNKRRLIFAGFVKNTFLCIHIS